MELGICTFVDNLPDPVTGKMISAYQRMQDLLEEVELTEQVGLDVFAIGEHHRVEYLVSSPAVVLAAAAARTKRLKLSSAVTVLSSDDPVRVFQDFATLDLLSGGRAEIMAGRGSFIESFPLFGYDLRDYDELFTEKLDLLLKLNEKEKITWKGKHRPAINNLGVYPRPYRDKLSIWIAVGGTPESIMRAGNLGVPLALAIIGGEPHRFAPLIQLYRDTAQQAGHSPETLQVSINSHVFIADTSQQAADVFFPSYADIMSRIGRERGWGPMSRGQFEVMRGKRGSLLVGSPQEIIDKIMYQYELFHNTRFLAQMSVGSVPHKQMMRSIELFGTQVAPVIRKELAATPVK
ncbi:LLM class flavin-dependent oxidoreductase [Pseudoflavitalea sp. X16]|uniref:LLM class flavin-dependent oxidoreductase n=1 Tax=Paraflavitalea devenefica TaxID=2716334 RepID=UPI00141E3D11|nr:LLM class flavin-dependent oxidoreductase [Paraflavitalea devenefica]NII24346.1 LLM class flavin-dependent oxidoreductase [Paraflavitalea devenefica]